MYQSIKVKEHLIAVYLGRKQARPISSLLSIGCINAIVETFDLTFVLTTKQSFINPNLFCQRSRFNDGSINKTRHHVMVRKGNLLVYKTVFKDCMLRRNLTQVKQHCISTQPLISLHEQHVFKVLYISDRVDGEPTNHNEAVCDPVINTA